MIRKSGSFFASVAVHGLLIVVLIGVFVEVRELSLPPSEGRISFSLHHYNASPQPTIAPPSKKPLPDQTAQQIAPEPPKNVTPLAKTPAKKIVEVSQVLPEPEPAVVPDLTPLPEPPKVIEDAPIAPELAQSYESYAQSYVQNHLTRIASLLQEHLYYPRIARQRGLSGEVMVAFEILPSGRADHIEVLDGAHAILNKAAIQTIESLSGKFPQPKEALTLRVPIRYQLH